MSETKRARGRRPILGGIFLGIAVSMTVAVLLVGAGLAALPWYLLGGLVIGGGLGAGAGAFAAESVAVSVIETICTIIGEIVAGLVGFIGDMFSGISF